MHPKKNKNNNNNRIPEIELQNIPTMQINQNIIKPPPLPPVEYDSTIAKENQ
jgi:hypothetical protein